LVVLVVVVLVEFAGGVAGDVLKGEDDPCDMRLDAQ